MKYVVDIPKSMVIKSALKGLTLGITMKVPSNNQDFVIPTNIQLEPYTELNIYSHTDNPTGWELYQDYQKAKERYETWKKQKEEIHVGDEIVGIYSDGEITPPLVVLKVEGNYYFGIYSKTGDFVQGGLNYEKTGRHFDEVEELLKKIGSEE